LTPISPDYKFTFKNPGKVGTYFQVVDSNRR
jgi:hypothetical protein